VTKKEAGSPGENEPARWVAYKAHPGRENRAGWCARLCYASRSVFSFSCAVG
jgi:hypothetical protein